MKVWISSLSSAQITITATAYLSKNIVAIICASAADLLLIMCLVVYFFYRFFREIYLDNLNEKEKIIKHYKEMLGINDNKIENVAAKGVDGFPDDSDFGTKA